MIVSTMFTKHDVAAVLAANLRKAMGAHEQLNNQTALAAKSGVAQTSIGYMLKPASRAPTKGGKASSPTLTNIDKVARALGMQAWQLIYPDPDNRPVTMREREIHASIAANFQELHDLAVESGPSAPGGTTAKRAPRRTPR